MKLSIIVPVYQVEHTLKRCVESILGQSFRDYQLILVDDKSTDGSSQICDEYQQKDHRVQVVRHQQNCGLSEARNSGLKKAKGEYVTFIDSDDYIASNTLKPLMELLAVHHDYDILEYPIHEGIGNPRKQNQRLFRQKEYADMGAYWYETKAYQHTYAVNKIFKRELFRQVAFPTGKKFEDAFTLPVLLEKCHVIATTTEGLYNYCYNLEGITAQADGNDLRDLLDAHLQVIERKGVLYPINYDYFSHILNIALDVAEQTGEMPNLPSPDSVCKREGQEKPPLKVKLYKTLGMSNLCRLNKLVHLFYRKSR